MSAVLERVVAAPALSEEDRARAEVVRAFAVRFLRLLHGFCRCADDFIFT